MAPSRSQRGIAVAWLASAALAIAAAAARGAPADASTTDALPGASLWNFVVLLDGQPVGSHRYTLTPTATDAYRLVDDAQFEVKLLGVPVYRYRHHAVERWKGDCLEIVDALTDDNGHSTEVHGRADAGTLEVDVRAGGAFRATHAQVTTDACLMSFAYWTPRIEGRQHLLDPSSGKVTPVSVQALAPATLAVNGQDTPVRGLRVEGLAHPIDVWYAGDRWVGLDTMVQRDHRLSYRLR